MIRHAGQASARVLQVIDVKDLRGGGAEDDPLRSIHRYFALNGTFLAERDEFQAEQVEKVHKFRLHGCDIVVQNRDLPKFAQMKCDAQTQGLKERETLRQSILKARTKSELIQLQDELKQKE